MIFASLLTAVFLVMLLHSFVFVRDRSLRYGSMVAYLIAIFFLWNPDITTQMAKAVGIGRGVDFIMILLSVALINAVVFCIRYVFRLRRSLTLMARYLAERDAREQKPL